MRTYGFTAEDQLLFAREHAARLRTDWQAANGPRHDARRPDGDNRRVLASVRGAAGRLLIDMGRRVMPAEAEPCS